MVYWIVREQPLMRPPGGWADLPQDILYIQPVFLVGLNGAETPETTVYANLISVESSRLGSDGNEDLSDLYCSDFIQFGDLVLFRLGDHIVWRPGWSATLWVSLQTPQQRKPPFRSPSPSRRKPP